MENIVFSFSGGRTSAYMVEMLRNKTGHEGAKIIFCNTGKEHEKTLQFVNQCSQRWGGAVIWLEYTTEAPGYKIVTYETASRSGQPFNELIRKKKYLPNIMARYCTQELKIRPLKKYCIDVLGWKHWENVVGIRADEPRRYHKAKNAIRKERFTTSMPLYNMGITKQHVLDYWQKQPFNLEIPDYLGNCDFCFLKGKSKKLHIIRNHPEIVDWWNQHEIETGSTFRADYSIQQLLQMANQIQFEFDDPDIDCFCNVD